MIGVKTKKIQKGVVNAVEQVAQSLWFITFTPSIPVDVKAGQYVSILCDNLTLRRPFSVMENKNGAIGILFKKKGPGTEYISRLKSGDEVDFIGPLGNGFNIENKKSLLISAGVGSAPIFYLRNKMNEKNIDNLFVSGFTSQNEIPSNVKVDKITTDDGSLGKKGSVINYIEGWINEYKPEKIYACGPEIVLKLTVQIACKHSIPCEVAMEKIMACGIGVCKGCVIKVKDGDTLKNVTVCKDGPVFDGGKVAW